MYAALTNNYDLLEAQKTLSKIIKEISDLNEDILFFKNNNKIVLPNIVYATLYLNCMFLENCEFLIRKYVFNLPIKLDKYDIKSCLTPFAASAEKIVKNTEIVKERLTLFSMLKMKRNIRMHAVYRTEKEQHKIENEILYLLSDSQKLNEVTQIILDTVYSRQVASANAFN